MLLYKLKNPPRMPPNWESSSATFFNVSVFSWWYPFQVTRLWNLFFRVLRQTSLLYSKHCFRQSNTCRCFHGMFHKRSDCLLAAPAFGCIDDIIRLDQNLVVDCVDLLRAMVVPHQISHPVHRIYSICRSFVLMPIFS